MQKLLIIIAVLILFSVPVYAQDAAKPVTPSAATAAQITPTATPTAISTTGQRALATRILVLDIKTDYEHDGNGELITNRLSFKAKQTLFDNFLAELFVRLDKPMSNENLPVTTEILTAKFQYVSNFFNITAGRADLTKTISTLYFFGPYATAGQRYLDLIGFSIPFYLKAGIPELEEIELPPMAISLYYFPTMFNYIHTAYNGSQEYYLLQFRMNLEIAKCPSQMILNIGKSTTGYFNYSVLSSNPAIDLSVSSDIGGHFKINAAYGIINTALINNTMVVAGGIEAHNLREWLYVIDELVFETQLPLGDSTTNFTPERFPWFVTVKNKIGKFRYGIAATTTNNDYTFKTLVSNNSSFVPPFGSGNVYAPEGLTFDKRSDNMAAMYGYVGYEF
jgi:hypothetical protein